MNRYIPYIISGVIGGFVAVLAVKLSVTESHKTIQPSVTHSVSMNSSPTYGAIPQDFVEASNKSTSSVVHIFAEESPQAIVQNRRRSRDPFEEMFGFGDFFGNHFYSQPKNGTGSGVILNTDGYIVTNNHVVGFADKLTVTLADGKKYKAKKIGEDPSTDLAVIKIDNAKGLKPISVGDSEQVKVGEWVLAVGNPFGYLTSTVTAGIVSAKGRALDIIQDENKIEEFIQTDAVVNPGNSGGALVNTKGELIGINTAIATPTGVFAGYSFAIPTKIMKKVVDKIIQDKSVNVGVVLGVGGYDVNEEIVGEFKLKLKEIRGFYVAEIDQSSPANFGGMLPGDVIIAVNNQEIKVYDDIEKYLKYTKSGETIKIKVNRNGKEIVLPLHVS